MAFPIWYSNGLSLHLHNLYTHSSCILWPYPHPSLPSAPDICSLFRTRNRLSVCTTGSTDFRSRSSSISLSNWRRHISHGGRIHTTPWIWSSFYKTEHICIWTFSGEVEKSATKPPVCVFLHMVHFQHLAFLFGILLFLVRWCSSLLVFFSFWGFLLWAYYFCRFI